MRIVTLRCLAIHVFLYHCRAFFLRGPQYFKSHWQRPKQQSVLFYVTTHASQQHLWFWKHKWSRAAHRNVYIYFTYPNPDRAWFTTIPLLGYSVHSNPGYQEGAIQAMHDASILQHIDVHRFDWVVRLNPDVEIIDMAWLQNTLQNARRKVITAKCKPNGLPMTDFTIMKPDVFAKILKMDPMVNNAELDLWDCLRRLKVAIQYLPIPCPKDEQCRVLFPGKVMHRHTH